MASLTQRTRASEEKEPLRRKEPPEDLRFAYEPRVGVPWRGIALALFLLLLGVLMLVVAYLMFTGHLGSEGGQAWGFLAIGCLIFLPGFYETRIAYYAWRRARGYSYAHIPEM